MEIDFLYYDFPISNDIFFSISPSDRFVIFAVDLFAFHYQFLIPIEIKINYGQLLLFFLN